MAIDPARAQYNSLERRRRMLQEEETLPPFPVSDMEESQGDGVKTPDSGIEHDDKADDGEQSPSEEEKIATPVLAELEEECKDELAMLDTAMRQLKDQIEVTEIGKSYKVQTDKPHLVSLGSGRLSTAVTLLPLPEGVTSIGTAENNDIVIQGTGCEADHCTVENCNGLVTLYPGADLCSVDGLKVNRPTILSQGCMLCLGRSNYFRFNHPQEAIRMKNALPNPRISMAPIGFLPGLESNPDYYKNLAENNRMPTLDQIQHSVQSQSRTEQSYGQGLHNIQKSSGNSYGPGGQNNLSYSSSPGGRNNLSYSPAHNSGTYTTFHEGYSSSPGGWKDSSLLEGRNDLNQTPQAAEGNSDETIFNHRDNLEKENFVSKISRFEALTHSMANKAPPHVKGIQKYTYLNTSGSPPNIYQQHMGEKVFTKQTSTTRVSLDNNTADRIGSMASTASSSSFTSVSSASSSQSNDTVKSEEHVMRSRGTVGAKQNSVASIVSTDTSIWGSTSTMPDNYLQDMARLSENRDSVFSDISDISELTESQLELSLKHKQMKEERVKEQAQEKFERQRLEDILSMCAEYERQLEKEKGGSKDGPPYSTPTPPSSLYFEQLSDGSANSLERKRIKTNGSLLSSPTSSVQKLSSPTTGQGQFSSSPGQGQAFDFKVMSRSTSSTSEDDVDSGTIKRKPKVPTSLTNQEKYDNVDYDYVAERDPEEDPRTPTAASPEAGQVKDSAVEEEEVDIFECVKQNVTQRLITEAETSREEEEDGDEVEHAHVESLSVQLKDVESAKESVTEQASPASDQSIGVKSSSGVETSSDHSLATSEENDRRIQLEKLKKMRVDAVNTITDLKQKIVDIEGQQNEAIRELEMERALLEGEHQTEMVQLQREQDRINSLKQKQLELIERATAEKERKRKVRFTTQLEQEKMDAERHKLRELEHKHYEVEQQLECCSREEEPLLLDELQKYQDAIENQRKIFDDLEFQQLEVETRYEEEREVVQQQLLQEQNQLLGKYKAREERLHQIDKQQRDMLKQVKVDIEGLETERQKLVEEFRKEKATLSTIDRKIRELSRNNSTSPPGDTSSASAKSSDTEYEMKVNEEFFRRLQEEELKTPTNEMTMELSDKLAKTYLSDDKGAKFIEDQKKYLEDLKRRATQEGHVQWAEMHQREAKARSYGSVESEEGSVDSGSTPSDKATSLSSGEDHLEKLTEMERTLSQAQTEKIKQLENQVQFREAEMRQLLAERQRREDLERRLQDEIAKREELVEQQVKMREKQRQQSRPLTRYLPVKSKDFNLRLHIESAGHNLELCPHVVLDAVSCKGYLHKMGNRFKTWHKRWFVFDRVRRSFLYYTDKSEAKPRGGMYFQAIEEVYVDHLRTVKSPNTKLTFCVKTYDRTYYLVSPSPEAMRIWVDVIFTGAEGYTEFQS
ncbi:pleckstrin homology-like domain family B member 2 isoform X4 [Lingula anatina]|uniref:Pleckstrin homology-like domain family B member 1 n=1 Tax=Lingula anatina TaxID=7574 RepID=A0A1S3JKK0_LINAN|nr:pleckstrin homology-like domain family B member 2 isoform X4 [Lingula anatina]|eukprot:XP_013410434.1 pleckstrin homology-like domain family B member 2 isoform X4 [Lingula anatina]